MNTLTHFIDAQLSLGSDHLTAGERLGIDEANAAGLYEIIENEELNSRHLKGLAVSGSLFSLTTFVDVTFESCVFYASKMENCTFINCTFVDCKFEFTQVQHCRFNGCKMEDCTFSVSPIKKCTLAYCEFDYKADYYLNKEENILMNCAEIEPLTWEEVLEADSINEETAAAGSKSQDNSSGLNDETASLHIGIAGIVQNALAKIKAA